MVYVDGYIESCDGRTYNHCAGAKDEPNGTAKFMGLRKMTKAYSKELAEWVRKRDRATRHDRNVVTFLALKNDIAEALERGFTVKAVWEHMVEAQKVTLSYSAFCGYVVRYIRAGGPESGKVERPKESAQKIAGSKRAADRSKSQSHQQANKPADQLGGFTFNAAPNVEELI